jgi:hypothetical protein
MPDNGQAFSFLAMQWGPMRLFCASESGALARPFSTAFIAMIK